MCCDSICCIIRCCRVLISGPIFEQYNNLVFCQSTIITKNGIVVSMVIISFDHYSSLYVPQNIVMNSSVVASVSSTSGPIHPYSILSSIVNPVVRYFCTSLLSHHHLHYCAITLYQTGLGNFVMEKLWRVPNTNCCRSTCSVY